MLIFRLFLARLVFNSYIASRMVAADSATPAVSAATMDIVRQQRLVSADKTEDGYTIRSTQLTFLIPCTKSQGMHAFVGQLGDL